jgi:nucleoside-triphosphatase
MKPSGNLFVTGRPGVGKTTLVRAVVADLDVAAGGFTTAEIREAGRRVGFTVNDLDGTSGTLAHVALKSPHRVGRYGVNRDDLERIGVRAIERAVERSRLVVMDEIGRMELCSEAFQDAVMRALDAPVPVFGTIQDRSNRFLDAVRARPDVEVVRLTPSSRDAVRTTVRQKLAALLAGAAGRSAGEGRSRG